MEKSGHIENYLGDIAQIAGLVNKSAIEKAVNILADIQKNEGRIYFLGVGGGAGNASHAVNDFRKIAGMDACTPTDNVSELTARVNDEGWDTSFISWLKCSRLSARDCVFILSVGGGNAEKHISNNLVHALRYAKDVGSKIIGIVGRDGGYTAKVADVAIIIPNVNEKSLTPHVESFQSVICHLLVSHPAIKKYEMKWESVK